MISTPVVYLAGPMSGKTSQEAEGWRNYAANILGEYRIESRSPMRDKELLWTSDDHTIQHTYDHVLGTSKGITTRDRNDVINCDGVIAVFEDTDRVSIGTMIELGWADAWRKPVVVVLDDTHQHPMVHEIAGYICDDVDEACAVMASVLGRY